MVRPNGLAWGRSFGIVGIVVPWGHTLNTPRDFNQPFPPQGQGQPVPWQGPGTPQQSGTPWYQQLAGASRPPAFGSAPQNPPPAAPPYAGAGQYGQPPPAQWGPPTPGPWAVAPKSRGSGAKALMIVAALIAALMIMGAGALLVSGLFTHDTKKIAVAGVQTEVQQILADRITGYNPDDIKDVKCNNGQDPTVKEGGSFTCDVDVRGKQHQLTVTFPDNSGAYEVGLPQLSGGK